MSKRFLFKASLLFGYLSLSGCQAQLSSTDSGGPPEEPPASSSPTSDETTALQLETRLADRHSVASTLRLLFVPLSVPGAESAERATLISHLETLVTSQISDFGGSCDYQLTSNANCGDGLIHIHIAAMAGNTSSRAALSLRAINEMLASRTYNVGLKSLISHVKSVTYANVSLSGIAAPTRAELASLVQIVHPGVEASEASLDALEDLSDQALSRHGAIEAWRFVALAVISNLAWQIL